MMSWKCIGIAATRKKALGLLERCWYVIATDSRDDARELPFQRPLEQRWNHCLKRPEVPTAGSAPKNLQNRTSTASTGRRIEYALRYTPSKRERFKGVWDAQGNFADLD